MREMTNDELIMYNILKENQDARNSNYEAVRQFFLKRYSINLPILDDTLSVFTVERMIRMLKSIYRECTDDSSNKIKKEQEIKFKENALDDNKPLKPQLLKSEEIKLDGIWW